MELESGDVKHVTEKRCAHFERGEDQMVSNAGKAVLCTTEFRGVFFGFATEAAMKNLPAEITLTNARNCIYWAASVGGFAGLAAKGPKKDCKIGAQVSQITLYKITSVTPVSESAAKAWADA